MNYSNSLKFEVRKSRQRGYSYNEIAQNYKLPRSTIYEWTKNEVLDNRAQNRIITRRYKGIENTKLWWKSKRDEWDRVARGNAQIIFSRLNITNDNARLLAACLFWAEGSKSLNSLIFMNSDPNMIRSFLKLLRLGYKIDEQKFRVLLHLHEYHDDEEMIRYWALVTNIPRRQFNHIYHKPHTKKRKHESYLGSCSLRYYDASIARELTAIYNTLVKELGL